MSRRVLGLLSFVAGLIALVAGFALVALVLTVIGLLFVASTAGSGLRNKKRDSDSTWYGSGAVYSSDNSRCDTDGGSGDCGGGDGGGGSGGD